MINDMNHMNYIDVVAASDVKLLREKEATYQGSWKRAGGRSAWFMLRRNMDRILTMMKPPKDDVQFSIADFDDALVEAETENKDFVCDHGVARYLRDHYLSEDIFAKIEEHPDGEDGTILACVRDLRCYLTLVEAEMMSRGVVDPDSGCKGEVRIGVINFTNRVEVYGLNSDESDEIMKYAEEIIARRGSMKAHVENSSTTVMPPSTVDADRVRAAEMAKDYVDGRFYAHEDPPVSDSVQPPWLVNNDIYEKLSRAERDLYVRRGAYFFLEPYVERAKMLTSDSEISHCYFAEGSTLYLDLNKISATLREHYIKLPHEQNDKEYSELNPVWKIMYNWHDGKWRLKPKYEAWARD